MRSALRVALATGVFAIAHSLLASTRAKDAFAGRVRFGRELYRIGYNAQAGLAFGCLAWYIARQPKRTLYRLRGPLAVLMRLGQFGGVAFGFAAGRATGLAKLSGLDNVVAILAGLPVRQAPAAQGPEADERGVLRASGPFTLVRHPLNVAPLAAFWLAPHMTTRRLAFNVVATAYLVIGSVHEEKRLLRAYGEAYQQYQDDGVPFFWPALASRKRIATTDGSERTARTSREGV